MPERICLKFSQLIGITLLYILYKFQANRCRQGFEKNTFSPHFIWCRGPMMASLIGPALWQPPLSAWPRDSPIAPQFSLGLHLNLISINYDNLLLHSFFEFESFVKCWMWIGKKSLNNFICHLSQLRKLSPTHTYPLISIAEFSKPYEFFFFLSLSHL